MKRICLLLFLLLVSCNQEKPRKLIPLLPFAEKTADTETLLFTTGRFADPDGFWSEPRKEAGGRFRWMTKDRATISWSRPLSEPGFLHLRAIARESLSMDVYMEGKHPVRQKVEAGPSHVVVPVSAGIDRIEIRLPQPEMLGVHSAIVSPSRMVAEFRRPAEFAIQKSIYIKGKKQDSILFQTGGSVNFYERLSSDATLEAGYYFLSSGQQDDSATFSIYADCNQNKRKKIFEKRTASTTFHSVRFPIPNENIRGNFCRFEFHVARQTAWGKSIAAWIDPRVWNSKPRATTQPAPIHRTSLDEPDYRNKNVVLIVLDAASVRRFGCYGYQRATTPVIDQLAAEGIQFLRAYTNAVYTLASTATLFTGQMPARHGILHHRNKLPRESKTLAEVLQSSGYSTGAFIANGNASGAFGLMQGFETAREVFRDKDYVGWGQDITDSFSEWLHLQNRKKFFAYLHYREPHDPFNPPEPWVKRFVGASYAGNIGKTAKDRIRIATNSSQLTDEDRTHISNLYDANLAYADSQVGEVLTLLRKAGVDQDTIIVITSDHGEAMWEHGYQGHNKQVYEESARVPLIFRLPRNRSAHKFQPKIEFPVQHADLYPTILSLLGIRARGPSLDGINFVSPRKGAVSVDRSIMVQSTRKFPVALIMEDYKYIRNEEEPHELYNLAQDPFEQENRITAETVRAGYMNQLLQQRLAAYAAAAQTAESVELDEAARENLKALGYVD